VQVNDDTQLVLPVQSRLAEAVTNNSS